MEIIDIFIGKIKNNSILFTYYTFFAGIATIVDFSVLYYLTNVIGIYYLISGLDQRVLQSLRYKAW